MERKQKRSLIGYRFGTGSAQSLLARRPLILSGAVTVFLLGLLIVLLAIRQPLDVDILPDPSRMPRRVPGGAIISTFVLSLKNRTAEEMTVRMRAASGERQLSIVPDAVVLGGGEHRRMTVRISREGDDAAITGPVPVLVTIEAGTPGKPTIRMSRRTVLLPPWTEGGR